MAKRSYYGGDTAALISLSQGSCYWPECGEPVLRFVGEQPMLNLEIAHIRAAHPNGPRYVKDMTEDDRRSFSNLIFLCRPHHTMVDKRDEKNFPIELLERWKSDRERSGRAALTGLRGLTEERLEEMLVAALEARDRQITDALARLEQVDTEAARVLRDLIGELTDLSRRRWLPDADTVGMLAHAADRLRGINEDTVGTLIAAADNLGGINEDTVSSLANAAQKLQGLNEDSISSLQSAATKLRFLPEMVADLHDAAQRLRR